jgi:hypothetical protein
LNKAFSIFFDPSKLEALTPDKVQNRSIFNPLPLLCTRRSTLVITWRNKEKGTFLSTTGIGKRNSHLADVRGICRRAETPKRETERRQTRAS